MQKILLIGAGYMALEYAKVLKALNLPFIAICRTKESADKFSAKTSHKAYWGGVEKFLNNTDIKFKIAIVASNADSLKAATEVLVKYGIKKILVEKPAGINKDEIESLYFSVKDNRVELYVGYNRRFYQSVLKGKHIIDKDGGAISANFEFTEWPHIIEKHNKSLIEKKNWFLLNSSHVVDLAFFMIGKPKTMNSITSGMIDWHKPAVYAGCGETENATLFTYHANWLSAGRWGLEILTPKRKLIYRPLEKLKVQNKGTITVEDYDNIEYDLDLKYKPGLYVQVESFIGKNVKYLKSIKEQYDDLKFYEKINN